MPGRRSMIRYCPVLSVTAERVFSMSAELDASTVTPGSTAPEASRTVPVSAACASAGAGSRTRTTMRIAVDDVSVRIEMTPPQLRDPVAADRIACRRDHSHARFVACKLGEYAGESQNVSRSKTGLGCPGCIERSC